MSTFDIQQFMQTETLAAGDSTYKPVPEKAYVAAIKSVTGDSVQGAPVMRVEYILDDQEARDITGLPEPTVEQTLWLDINPAGNGLDFGVNKNVKLGQVREACGQNDPSRGWSPNMLVGQVVLVSVKHRMATDGSGDVFAKVSKVTKRP